VKEGVGGSDASTWVLDETGFLKKGIQSAGVQRQYSGTAGRIENSQVGVFLCYARRTGHVLLDRELYLPQDWVRMVRAAACRRIPKRSILRPSRCWANRCWNGLFKAGMPCGWVAGDEVYGRCTVS